MTLKLTIGLKEPCGKVSVIPTTENSFPCRKLKLMLDVVLRLIDITKTSQYSYLARIDCFCYLPTYKSSLLMLIAKSIFVSPFEKTLRIALPNEFKQKVVAIYQSKTDFKVLTAPPAMLLTALETVERA